MSLQAQRESGMQALRGMPEWLSSLDRLDDDGGPPPSPPSAWGKRTPPRVAVYQVRKRQATDGPDESELGGEA
jgi:hypothetical protein